MTRDFRRVLVVLFGAIGDVTRALPLLHRVRRGYPTAHIAWAVEPLSAPLLENHPALNECIIFERARGVRGFASFLRHVRQQRFDLVLDLGRQLKSGITALASGAPVRVGFDRTSGREGNWCFQTTTVKPPPHMSSKLAQFLCFGDLLGLDPVPVEFGLAPTVVESERVSELLRGLARPFAAFVLGSSCPSRRWFPDRTAATAQALWSDRGYPAVLLGTEADRSFAARVATALDCPVLDLVGATNLREAIGVLRHAAIVISPDSGAMHLAAAVGRPVVSLWGATSAARSAPHGSEALTLIGHAGCAPCYLKHCPIGRVCMEDVRVEDVLAHVSTVLPEHDRVGT
jgi:lipopolysaccharide heptosyltransferase II